MPRLPVPSESAIRDWTGEASFGRGRSCFRDGAVVQARRQDKTLKARCFGSPPQPYRVEAALGSGGIAGARCSCPVGGGGRCKHVAAMLLAWRKDPDSFSEVQDPRALGD